MPAGGTEATEVQGYAPAQQGRKAKRDGGRARPSDAGNPLMTPQMTRHVDPACCTPGIRHSRGARKSPTDHAPNPNAGKQFQTPRHWLLAPLHGGSVNTQWATQTIPWRYWAKPWPQSRGAMVWRPVYQILSRYTHSRNQLSPPGTFYNRPA